LIFSNYYSFAIFSPPKTGTKIRHAYYRSINDLGGSMANAHSTVEQFNRCNLNRAKLMKFCFVRNPWDRIVSMFHMFNQLNSVHQRHSNFKQFIMNYSIKTMDEFYTINREMAVDKIFTMENLSESIRTINSIVKYTSQDIQTSKTQYDVNYKEWLDQEMIEFIAEKEKYTLNLIDYQFNLI